MLIVGDGTVTLIGNHLLATVLLSACLLREQVKLN
jgi:hypothetical protein